MRAHRRLVALLLSTFLLGSCAASHSGSFSGRFIQPGEPVVDVGGPPIATGESSRAERLEAQQPTAGARLRQSTSLGASVEDSDARLSSALLAEAAMPTPANHLRVALEYRRLGILDACADRLSLALQKAPRMAAAHETLARLWRDWGLSDLGLGSAYRAIYHAPKSASAQNTLGTILADLGRVDDARIAYERALSLDPTAAWALNNLCALELRVGHLDEARARCQAALRVTPTLVAAHNNLALALAASGDLDGARRQFLAAGNVAAANYNFGIVLLAERDYSSAADAFEEAIRARPSFTAAKARAHAARLRLLIGAK